MALIRERLGSPVAACYRTVAEAQVIEVLLLSGWAFEVEAGRRAEAVASTAAALELWIALGLEYRRSDRGERLFDPVEVVNFMKWAGHNGHDRFWIDHHVGTARALVSEWTMSTVYGEPSSLVLNAARFDVTLQRTFDMRHFERGTKLRFRLPLPLPGAHARDIEVLPVVSAELCAVVGCSDGRMEVRLAAPDQPIVEIGAEVSFTAIPCPKGVDDGVGRLDPVEAEIYLRPVEGLIRISPRVHALANALAGPESSAWTSVKSFWTFMIDELSSGMVHYDQIPADAPGDWVLDSGWFDCQLGSALLVSMCRARGIPARIVGGHFLYPLSPVNHFWTEVWIDGRGWAPFDFQSWDLSAGGRDQAWRDRFAGKIDYRLVTQCLPLAFTGPMSVRFPPAWHMVVTRAGGGVGICFSGIDGSPIYTDRIAVHPSG
jgi:hypothetical protein